MVSILFLSFKIISLFVGKKENSDNSFYFNFLSVVFALKAVLRLSWYLFQCTYLIQLLSLAKWPNLSYYDYREWKLNNGTSIVYYSLFLFRINSLFFFKFFLVFILPYSLNVSKIFPWFQVLFHDYTFAVAHKCLGGQVNSHRFCHSSQKHIMACNGIVIRLHPLWHFTSAWLLTSAVKNWRCLAVSSLSFAVNCGWITVLSWVLFVLL